MKNKINDAIKYYKEHKDELKPVVEKAVEFFQALNKDRDVEARELVSRYASVAEQRAAREGVEAEIQRKNKMADAISLLGLVIKLFAKGI